MGYRDDVGGEGPAQRGEARCGDTLISDTGRVYRYVAERAVSQPLPAISHRSLRGKPPKDRNGDPGDHFRRRRGEDGRDVRGVRADRDGVCGAAAAGDGGQGDGVLRVQPVPGGRDASGERRELHQRRQRRERELPRGDVCGARGSRDGRNRWLPRFQGLGRGDGHFAAGESLRDVQAVVSFLFLSLPLSSSFGLSG